MVLAIAGNKVDLPGRVVSADTAAEYAEEVGAISCDTSAATGKGTPHTQTLLLQTLVCLHTRIHTYIFTRMYIHTHTHTHTHTRS